jgi:exopolysaccharide biosynthesis polyprenyl glycosylphosphotransferase
VRQATTTAGAPQQVRSAPARLGLRHAAAWSLGRFSLDAALLAAAALAAAFGSRAAGIETPPVGWLALFGLFVLGAFAARGVYRPRLRSELLEDLRGVVVTTSLAAIAVLTLRELLTNPPDLAAQVIRPWAFATVYIAAGRVAIHWSQAQARRQGEGLRPTLIIGAGRIGRLTAKRLLEHPELGLKPVGFLDKDPLEYDGAILVPVLGSSWDLDRVVEEHGVEQVIVTFSTAPNEVLLRLARRCEELGLAVAFVPRLFEKMTTRLEVDYLGGLPLITARAPKPRGWQFGVKYLLDRVAATVLITLVSPLLAAAALAVWLSSGRPIFFRQHRVGRDGQEFQMLKFRTMRGDATCGEADAGWAREQLAAEADPERNGNAEIRLPADEDRQTRVGTILRKSSIDELPQLFNVLAGHMSIVGPRPERTHYVNLFEQNVYRYADRHRVKSGITGWAQVNGLRGKTSLADRVEWDNHYIENWSLWLDFKILLLTAVAVFRSSRHVE